MSKRTNQRPQVRKVHVLTATVGKKQVSVSFWSREAEGDELTLAARAEGLDLAMELSPTEALQMASLLLNAAEQHKQQKARETARQVAAVMKAKKKRDVALASAFRSLFGGRS